GSDDLPVIVYFHVSMRIRNVFQSDFVLNPIKLSRAASSQGQKTKSTAPKPNYRDKASPETLRVPALRANVAPSERWCGWSRLVTPSAWWISCECGHELSCLYEARGSRAGTSKMKAK